MHELALEALVEPGLLDGEIVQVLGVCAKRVGLDQAGTDGLGFMVEGVGELDAAECEEVVFELGAADETPFQIG